MNKKGFALIELLTVIGKSAFAINDLTSAYIPSSITQVKDYAFAFSGISDGSTLNISKLIFESGSILETIGDSAFCQNAIEGDVTLPDTVTTIEGGTFLNNNITILNLGSKITKEGDHSFYGNDLQPIIINMTENDFNTKVTVGNEQYTNWYSGNPTINFKQ